MISPLMFSSKTVKVSQKRCLGTSIETFILPALLRVNRQALLLLYQGDKDGGSNKRCILMSSFDAQNYGVKQRAL